MISNILNSGSSEPVLRGHLSYAPISASVTVSADKTKISWGALSSYIPGIDSIGLITISNISFQTNRLDTSKKYLLEANIFWFPGRNHWYDETRMLYYDGYCWTVTHWEGSGQLLDSEFSISATSGFYTKGEAAFEARASYYTPRAWYYSKTEV